MKKIFFLLMVVIVFGFTTPACAAGDEILPLEAEEYEADNKIVGIAIVELLPSYGGANEIQSISFNKADVWWMGEDCFKVGPRFVKATLYAREGYEWQGHAKVKDRVVYKICLVKKSSP